jgi:hypothetical protein
MFQWYREIRPVERRTFWACFGGWALDALDVQMFSRITGGPGPNIDVGSPKA